MLTAKAGRITTTAIASLGLLGTTLAVGITPVGAVPTWTISSSPSPGSSSQLIGVSCTSATFCMAVGSLTGSKGYGGTLVESWNGHTWSVSPSPSHLQSNIALNGVSCTSTTFCMAVGFYANEISMGPDRTLIESWNGSTWSFSSSPNPGGTNAFDGLDGVSCTSTTSCVAVGSSSPSTVSDTLIESWNGSTWSVSHSPNPGTDEYLNGVSCTSTTSCMAVGSTAANIRTAPRTLIEAWNGSTWSVSPSRNPGSYADSLNGVSCSSASSCHAVGMYFTDPDTIHTLAESWNGDTWSTSPAPEFSLNGVSCISAISCKAVGTQPPGDTLVESLYGHTWSVSSSPSPAEFNNLYGVSCTSITFCVAVGSDAPTGRYAPDQTLIESYG